MSSVLPEAPMSFGLGIDKDLPTPAYLQLKEQLANAIDSGQLASGSALPSERGLASSLGLSRMTVRRAFEQLVEAGLVEQRQGSGTYVRGQALEQFIDRVLSFGDEARNLGFDPGTRMVESHLQPAEEAEAAALKVPLGSQILRINRLRTADGEPLAIQEAHLPPHLAELSIELLDRTGSLYRSLESQFGLRPVRAHQTISARLPTRKECHLLGISREVPVLALERTTFGVDESPFEYVRSAYRGDIYRMALDLRAL